MKCYKRPTNDHHETRWKRRGINIKCTLQVTRNSLPVCHSRVEPHCETRGPSRSQLVHRPQGWTRDNYISLIPLKKLQTVKWRRLGNTVISGFPRVFKEEKRYTRPPCWRLMYPQRQNSGQQLLNSTNWFFFIPYYPCYSCDWLCKCPLMARKSQKSRSPQVHRCCMLKQIFAELGFDYVSVTAYTSWPTSLS